MSLAPPIAERPMAAAQPRGISVLAHAALARAGGVLLVLVALWLAVAWAVAVP